MVKIYKEAFNFLDMKEKPKIGIYLKRSPIPTLSKLLKKG